MPFKGQHSTTISLILSHPLELPLFSLFVRALYKRVGERFVRAQRRCFGLLFSFISTLSN